MNDIWKTKAERLRNSIQDVAIAEYLDRHSQEEIAAAAGGEFLELSTKAQGTTIQVLANRVASPDDKR
ncbi:MAG TPA: hypothetical protein EYQ36_13440 [Sulfitobacter sp.]|nr:hypothetical protein [Sulfitobacter sp.]